MKISDQCYQTQMMITKLTVKEVVRSSDKNSSHSDEDKDGAVSEKISLDRQMNFQTLSVQEFTLLNLGDNTQQLHLLSQIRAINIFDRCGPKIRAERFFITERNIIKDLEFY